LLSKSMGVILPMLFLVLDFWPLKRLMLPEHSGGKSASRPLWRIGARLVAEKTPLLALSVAFVFMTVRAEANVGAVRSLEQFSIGDRALNCISAIPLYVKRMLVPADYTVYYPIRVWSAGALL